MYRLLTFDGVTLPRTSTEVEIGTSGTRTALIPYNGGVIDADGTARSAKELPYQLTLRAELVGSSLATLRTELDALRAKRGVTGQLVREGIDDPGTTQWATARLLQVGEPRQVRNVYYHTVNLVFLVLTPWHGATITVSSSVTASTVINFANAGQLPITATIWTLTAPGMGGTIPGIQIYRSDYATHIAYDAVVATSQVWTLNTANWAVENNGVADAQNLHIAGGHRLPDLVQIEPGGSTYTLAIPGGGASTTFTIEYDELYE